MTRTPPLDPTRDSKPSPQSENMVRTLEKFITSVISEQITAMLDSADDILFELANKSHSNEEQRTYLDTLRVIRLEKPRLLRTFQDNLHQSFADHRLQRAATVDLDDIETWSLRGSDDIQEMVFVNNLEAKASDLYQKEIQELERRMETLAQRAGGHVPVQLIAPSRIFDAMRGSLKSMDMDLPVKRVIYQLAERSLVGNLGQVYAGANQMLASRGFEPRGASGKAQHPARSAARASPFLPVPPPNPATAALWPAGLNPQRLLSGLSAVAGAEFQSSGYSDSQLATEMATVLNALAHGRPAAGWMPAPNLVLAGRMFDLLYQDRMLPEHALPLLHRLQYPVMKTALADAEFFRSPNHPVRQLVHEVFEMLAGISQPEPEDVERLGDLIGKAVREFEVSAEHFGHPENRAQPVSEADAAKFMTDQESCLAAHASRNLEKVRRLVAMELQLRTAPRAVPAMVRPLLLSGFGPMLVHAMLNGGSQGMAWKTATVLLERMLDALDPLKNLGTEQRASEQSAIQLELGQRLLDIGLPNSKAQRLMAGLGDAFRNPGHCVPEADRGLSVARQALTTLLLPGAWFQIYDPSTPTGRWLKLRSHTAAQDSVVFDNFLGTHQLRMSVTALLHDLVTGRAVPADPNPTVRRALTLLPPLAAATPAATVAAQWVANA